MRGLCIWGATALILALTGLPQGAAAVAQAQVCLSKEQRQEMIASGKVVSLAAARRAVPGPRGELLRARLCESPTGLVYLLTLVGRDGKVTRATVDAGSGKLAEVR